MFKSALVEMWGCSAGKHVPHTVQACNLLLGTVQAACLTAQSQTPFIAGITSGGFLLIGYLPFNLPCDWVTLKVMLSSLKNMRTALPMSSDFHLVKLGASHSVMRQVRNQWCLGRKDNFNFHGKLHLCQKLNFSCVKAQHVYLITMKVSQLQNLRLLIRWW